MDRVRAVRLAVRAIKFIEEKLNESVISSVADDSTAVVIGISGAQLQFRSVTDLDMSDTEWETRRPKNAFWRDVRKTADMLSQPPPEMLNDPNYVASYKPEQIPSFIPK